MRRLPIERAASAGEEMCEILRPAAHDVAIAQRHADARQMRGDGSLGFPDCIGGHVAFVAIGRCVHQHENAFAFPDGRAIAAILRAEIEGRFVRQGALFEHIVEFGRVIPIEKDIVMRK